MGAFSPSHSVRISPLWYRKVVLFRDDAGFVKAVTGKAPCAATVFICQAVHGIIAAGDSHLILSPICTEPCAVLPCPVTVQVIEHEGIVKQPLFRSVTDGEAADITVTAIYVTGFIPSLVMTSLMRYHQTLNP